MVMDTTEVRPPVTGATLAQFAGKTVTLIGSVISTAPNGMSFDIKTPDRQVVTVSLRSPLSEPLLGLVEVHGIVASRSTIVSNYHIALPSEISQTYDPDLVTSVFNLIHSVPNAWTNTSSA